MPYVLTEEALNYLDNNPIVAAQAGTMLGLKTTGVGTALIRKSKSLNTWHTVELLAKSMGRKPKDILEET